MEQILQRPTQHRVAAGSSWGDALSYIPAGNCNSGILESALSLTPPAIFNPSLWNLPLLVFSNSPFSLPHGSERTWKLETGNCPLPPPNLPGRPAILETGNWKLDFALCAPLVGGVGNLETGICPPGNWSEPSCDSGNWKMGNCPHDLTNSRSICQRF